MLGLTQAEHYPFFWRPLGPKGQDMNRVEMFLRQMAVVLSECSEKIIELTELGLSLEKREQRMRELQRKLERAPEIGVTEERAHELFLKSADLQSALGAEEYKYYISAATEAEMMERTKDFEPDLRREARKAIKEYARVRIPHANIVTLRKAHAAAQEMVSWAGQQTIRLRFERKFRCRLPRGEAVA